MERDNLYTIVNNRYGEIAKNASFDHNYGEKVAAAFGYSKEDLLSTPVGANLGLGCGNPLAMASIKKGESVVDLGSGAGFDAFLAVKRVGESGDVIGIDMNPDMLSKARDNAVKMKFKNVSFLEGRITAIPLSDGVADCVISNCVINLVPEQDKHLVFKEAFRVLKPGGRLAVSDILAKRDMPDSMKASMALYVGCISNASLVQQYEEYIRDAGFQECIIADTNSDLNVYSTAQGDDTESSRCCGNDSSSSQASTTDGLSKKIAGQVGCCGAVSDGTSDATSNAIQPSDLDFNEWAGSYKIFAIKPYV